MGARSHRDEQTAKEPFGLTEVRARVLVAQWYFILHVPWGLEMPIFLILFARHHSVPLCSPSSLWGLRKTPFFFVGATQTKN